VGRQSASSARRWLGWRKLERHEIVWLLTGLGVCSLLFAFIILAGEVLEGETTALDTQILVALRNATDSSHPIGPAWVEYAMLDLTAIGGPTVLWLVVGAVLGFLVLQRLYHSAGVVLVAAVSGELVNLALKHWFMRPRPTIVPHLREVLSLSFPSGHAMESAIIYLTLGTMLMRIADRRLTKLYCLAVPAMLTFLVGISRVFLGVHYPTDVIGGWIIGFMWASLCWLVAQRTEGVTHVKAESKRVNAA
jgi:undecaprenyl-diphosphatase